MTTTAAAPPTVRVELQRDIYGDPWWVAEISCTCSRPALEICHALDQDRIVTEAELVALDHRRTTGHRIEWPLVREGV